MAFPNDDNIKFVILGLVDDSPQTLEELTAVIPDEFLGATIPRDRIERQISWLCEQNLLTQSAEQYTKGTDWMNFMNYAAKVLVGDDPEKEATLAFQNFHPNN